MKSWRYIVPNFFTALSLCLGIASILLANCRPSAKASTGEEQA